MTRWGGWSASKHVGSILTLCFFLPWKIQPFSKAFRAFLKKLEELSSPFRASNGLVCTLFFWAASSCSPGRSKINFASGVLHPSVPSFGPLSSGQAGVRLLAEVWVRKVTKFSCCPIFHIPIRGVPLPFPLGWVPLCIPNCRVLWERACCWTCFGLYLKGGCVRCFFGVCKEKMLEDHGLQITFTLFPTTEPNSANEISDFAHTSVFQASWIWLVTTRNFFSIW